LKILQLISSYGFFGSENVVLEHAMELKKRGVENTIGVFENSHNPHTELYERACGARLKAVVFKCNGKVDIGAINAVRTYIRDEKVDILHSHGYKSNIYGFAAAKLTGRPIVSTCHNWIAADLKTRFYYKIDKRILPFFSKVVAVSDTIVKELGVIGVKPGKMELILNGIGTERFKGVDRSMREEFGIDEKTMVVGSVGRLSEEKGLGLLLDAAASVLVRFPDTVFLLVGDGPLRAALEEKAKALNIGDKIIFAGIRKDIPRVYSAFDIFVLPSLLEGLPMVLLEAMAAARPILTSAVGAIPKVIQDGRQGLLMPPGDADVIKEGLLRLLGDRSFSDKLGKCALKRLEDGFSSSYMSSKYIEVYEESLGLRKKNRDCGERAVSPLN